MAFFRKNKQLRKKAPMKRRAPVRRAPLAKLVKSIVSRNTETKFCSNQYSLTSFNSGINSAGDFITVLPQVPLGTGQNQRIGSSIKPTKLVIRGFLQYKSDTNLGARMIGTRMFCFSEKLSSNYGTITSAGPNFQLLDVGGGTTGFNGQTIQYNMPVNNEMFKFYADKKHVMMKPYGYTNTFSPTYTVDIASVDKSLYKPFTITIPASKMPANLKFDEQLSTTQPINFAPYLALGYCDLLGYPPDTTVTQIYMQFVATLYYKDA